MAALDVDGRNPVQSVTLSASSVVQRLRVQPGELRLYSTVEIQVDREGFDADGSTATAAGWVIPAGAGDVIRVTRAEKARNGGQPQEINVWSAAGGTLRIEWVGP